MSGDDPWNQPQSVPQPAAGDDPWNQPQPAQPTPNADPWNSQPQPKPQPQVAAEDDEYSMSDQSLGEATAMNLDDLKKLFEVKKSSNSRQMIRRTPRTSSLPRSTRMNNEDE